MSSLLNTAYCTLVDPGLRSVYDKRLSLAPDAQRTLKRSFKDTQGLVGPLSDSHLIMRDAIISKDQDEGHSVSLTSFSYACDRGDL